MAEYGKPGYLNLNANNQWPHFQRRGLELNADGVLSLFSLPRLETDLPLAIEQAPEPSSPCAIAVAWDGSLFYIGPSGELLCVNGCSGGPGTVVSGLGGSTTGLASLDQGKQIAILANSSIAIFDVDRRVTVEVRRNVAASAIASDDQGSLYVASTGTNLIRRFDRFGIVRWEGSAPLIEQCAALAVAAGRIFALGRIAQGGSWQIVSWKPSDQEAPRVHGVGMLERPSGLVASAVAVYVGENSLRRVLKLSIDDDGLAGAAVGYRGPVGGLAIQDENLYVHAGGSSAPLALVIDAGCAASGVLWGKVSSPKTLPVTWHRGHASLGRIEANNDPSHVQFYVAANHPPDPSTARQPFGPGWTSKGLDASDFFVGVGKTNDVWLGVHLFSDGVSSPQLSQIQVNYDQPTYLASLPVLYRDQGKCGDFLLRYLSLFESFFAEGEAEIRAMPELFDPLAAPDEILPWLASWLAIDWDERWSPAKQREVIGKAFDLYGRRGTVAGLRDALELYAGVRAVIQEPIRQTAWWGLPSTPDCTGQGELTASLLGSTSALAGIEPQGAVLGVSAITDQSHLIRNEDFGKPLFEQTAHQFSVVLYKSQLCCDDTLLKVQEILDREKPAHTLYQLCVVEPRMRIGQQARVGVDAVIAGTPLVNRLGDGELRLAGEPQAPLGSARVGINSQI
jgi:phage tail-like protein